MAIKHLFPFVTFAVILVITPITTAGPGPTVVGGASVATDGRGTTEIDFDVINFIRFWSDGSVDVTLFHTNGVGDCPVSAGDLCEAPTLQVVAPTAAEGRAVVAGSATTAHGRGSTDLDYDVINIFRFWSDGAVDVTLFHTNGEGNCPVSVGDICGVGTVELLDAFEAAGPPPDASRQDSVLIMQSGAVATANGRGPTELDYDVMNIFRFWQDGSVDVTLFHTNGEGDCPISAGDLCLTPGTTTLLPSTCLGDLDRDGNIGINDFLLLLGSWGGCAQP